MRGNINNSGILVYSARHQAPKRMVWRNPDWISWKSGNPLEIRKSEKGNQRKKGKKKKTAGTKKNHQSRDCWSLLGNPFTNLTREGIWKKFLLIYIFFNRDWNMATMQAMRVSAPTTQQQEFTSVFTNTAITGTQCPQWPARLVYPVLKLLVYVIILSYPDLNYTLFFLPSSEIVFLTLFWNWRATIHPVYQEASRSRRFVWIPPRRVLTAGSWSRQSRK